MANRWFKQFFYTLHTKPVLLDCNFIVDSTNGNGLGLRSLKGPGVQNVFMNSTASFTGTTHTSTVVDSIVQGTGSLVVGMPVQGSGIAAGTTIASITSSSAITLSAATSTSVGSGTITYQAVGSPNPKSGVIMVQLQDCYQRYFGGFSGFVAPLTGTSISSGMTAGTAYVIVSVGTTTLAQWQGAGLPVGITPAVGVAFVATATSFSGTGRVQAALHSGVHTIEVVGDPNLTIQSSAATIFGVSSGAYLIVKCVGPKAVAFTGTTHTNTTVDSITSTQGLIAGQALSGAGIPLGTVISSVDSATAITISAAATASATVPITAVPGSGIVAPVDGTTVGMSFYLSSSRITVQGE